jgi:hypothetical protein
MIKDEQPFEKIDKYSVKFTLKLEGNSSEEFSYMLTTYHGARSENR